MTLYDKEAEASRALAGRINPPFRRVHVTSARPPKPTVKARKVDRLRRANWIIRDATPAPYEIVGVHDLNPTYSPSLRKPARSSDKKDWRFSSI